MRTKIQKWGNSLGLRIPKSLAVELGIEAGCEVDLSVSEGGLVVRAVRPERYELNELLRAVDRKNLQPEVETGQAVGRERW